MDKLQQANQLQAKIKELEEFLKIIDPHWNIQRGSGQWDIGVVIKTKVSKSISIFGSRWNGIGHREEEIRIPNTVIDELYSLFQIKLNTLKEEFDNLIPGNNA